MTDTITKTALLQQIQEGYEQLQKLLSSLSPAQLITPGVNGSWSVKDNLAHLTAWMDYTNQKMQAVTQQIPFVDPFVDQKEDEINEHFYQEAKDRSYQEVQARFQETFQQFVQSVEALSEEQLRAVPEGASFSLIQSIIGNSTEHFQEHRTLIERWLAQP